MAPKAANRAYIGLGANLGDPPAQLRAALGALGALPGTAVAAVSRFWRSRPLSLPGGEPAQTDQPDYCNAVCALDTLMPPLALLEALQAIETAAGRTRGGPRWGPRLLDLDLLHVEGVQIDSPRLTLPHPELQRRGFVLLPLLEIAPALEIPGLGRVAALAAALSGAPPQPWERRPDGAQATT
ncbi:MAG: 2-amino-4-hydroxy-6-hydroxymethyldihydropteridine diphosphokinase [Nevskia sp.]|nr:2-amino-4-hydroxy-6-hydroxymethyldihydropteridine diphosphokinase [Nevskia sp.]